MATDEGAATIARARTTPATALSSQTARSNFRLGYVFQFSNTTLQTYSLLVRFKLSAKRAEEKW